jgi:2-iminobutanoate/2-iminopropanoate deaminase
MNFSYTFAQKNMQMKNRLATALLITSALLPTACQHAHLEKPRDKPEYFLLRPKLEKMYGYTQAVKVGNILKIGGVISIDQDGAPLGKDDYLAQMKNCYSSLDSVLKHFGASFDDVYLENIYTTSRSELQQHAAYRHQIYKNHFPTGSWIGVKELGLPEMQIEIEVEALLD